MMILFICLVPVLLTPSVCVCLCVCAASEAESPPGPSEEDLVLLDHHHVCHRPAHH